MNKLKKVGIALGILFGSAGIAFATFLVTQSISTGNAVLAGSAGLTVTNTPIGTSGLLEGGSTSPNSLKIQNTGTYVGDVQLNLINVTGALCPDLTLTVTGDPNGTKTFAPIANGSQDLGNLAVGATFTLNQVVSMSATSSNLGQPCHWDETATLSGN